MPLEADLLADRARLRRRLSWWRAVAIAAACGALALLIGRGQDSALATGPHVLRLAVSGFIAEDRRTLEALERAATDPTARALIIAINSPGGTMAGGEAFYATLSRIAERKPVVAVMGATAASAGYMVALPAHRIFAREATLTGSIGVMLQSFEVSELLDRLGIRSLALTSGPLKDQPSPFRPLSEEGRAMIERVLADFHAQFIAKLGERRRLEPTQLAAVADGRVLSGRQALALGLIDAIGGEAEARAWLAAERGIPETLPLRDIETRSLAERLLAEAFTFLSRLWAERLGVDAPLALWQPGARS